MSIAENILRFRENIPSHVTLVAVSKTKPVSDLMEAYETGQRIFGENKIQEMTDKWEEMPKDIQWHMIGHVQTNKVKYMAPYVSLIHAVDRLKLIKEVNKQAEANDRVIDILIQIKIAREDSKFGMAVQDAVKLFEENTLENYPHVNVVGLMGMATFTDDQDQVAAEFELLEGLFLRFRESANLTILSSGMSGDYKLAIDKGSTMIRVGSSIFGAR
ncbi:YggS family pyridoxal phosphate-dependent enzyme [Dokdonia sp. Dokd-P16]|uniref:YggS family pyridoxal phosphate-dependent enzyme n=1 Tax=Dokdonia sp. Dokd-P16 TaxID=2173169 RepID=UPI000D549D70|nr:YggS family pyridoxal phosphate-dependent enzyme [Dokdonia sp. Dokd-P16]AWH74482.1 YggS family pyridoxal phosphate-dependent enzyme [Dokdonia sp. Dokd-P16]